MLRVIRAAGDAYGRPFNWTFGGGTVLALRHAHRFSKDIAVFVPDPQYLGYLSPRLGNVAALGGPDCEEGAEFVKLRYPEGEVDFVVATLLTIPGATPATVREQSVRLETNAEIMANKLFFRGDQFPARDLFDLAMVLERVSGIEQLLAPWALRHRPRIQRKLMTQLESLRPGFDAINALGARPAAEAAAERVLKFLQSLDFQGTRASR